MPEPNSPQQPTLFPENVLPEATAPAAVIAVTSAVSEDDDDEKQKIVRPDRNLEKWPIWEPSNSRHAPRARLIQREVQLADGSRVTAGVEVGFTNKGSLTTEDQRTCYGLIKLWEELGRPTGPVSFSRQQLARVLKKSWGSKVNSSLTASLMRLRFTPFTWERSYYDNTTRETVERIDTFNILSELHLARRGVDGRTTREASYFQFNERMLRNLLSHFTKPVFLDTILSFQSEIAQILYTHLDLVLSDKNHYERRSKELFVDLGIDGTTYRYVSKRAQMLEPALKELQGKPLPTGTLKSVTLEKTSDGLDLKIVARKEKPRGPRPGARAKSVDGGASGLSPVPVVVAPAAPPAAALPAPAADPAAMTADESAAALAQVRHFYQVFFKSGETAYPTPRELAQAQDHLLRLDDERARYLVTFAYREAKRTDFAIQTYGGIAQYEGRAIAEFEDNLRKRSQAILEKARKAHQERFGDAYRQYLGESYATREKTRGRAFLAFLSAEEKERGKFLTGPLAKHPSMQRVARGFEEEEARLKRFADFFRNGAKNSENGGEDAGENNEPDDSEDDGETVLDFWEWDATLSPEPFRPETILETARFIGRPINGINTDRDRESGGGRD